VSAAGLGVSVNAYTVVLEFSRAERARPDGGIREIPVATVNMSPQLAKALVAMLAEILATYEERIGPIPVPDEIRDRISFESVPAGLDTAGEDEESS
jgi:hypothetical protein